MKETAWDLVADAKTTRTQMDTGDNWHAMKLETGFKYI